MWKLRQPVNGDRARGARQLEEARERARRLAERVDRLESIHRTGRIIRRDPQA